MPKKKLNKRVEELFEELQNGKPQPLGEERILPFDTDDALHETAMQEIPDEDPSTTDGFFPIIRNNPPLRICSFDS